MCPVPFNLARAFVALGPWLVEGTKYVCRQGLLRMDLLLTAVGVEQKEGESPVELFFLWTPRDHKGLLIFGETGSPVP